MPSPTEPAERDKVWRLIKDARAAVLVTIGRDGALQSRPMGCLQTTFDGVLWFLTFRDSAKMNEIAANERVLVSYADSKQFEYVSIVGRARQLDDRAKIREPWNEGIRVWFPRGADDPDLALIAIDVDTATYWTNGASIAAYAWQYVRARLTGISARAEDIVDTKKVEF